jgi:hypothetical protein
VQFTNSKEENIPCGDDIISASLKNESRRTTSVFTRNFTVLTNIFTGDTAANVKIRV